MMRERKDETEETFVIDLDQEVYLKGRDEPVRVNSSFELRKDSINQETPVEDVMQMVTHHLLSTIDVVSEHRYLLSDRRYNKFCFLTDQIQAVSLLAPEEETVLTAMEV